MMPHTSFTAPKGAVSIAAPSRATTNPCCSRPASPLRKERSPLRRRLPRLGLGARRRLHRSERSGLHCGTNSAKAGGNSATGLHRSERSGLTCGAFAAEVFLSALSASPLRKERSHLRLFCRVRWGFRRFSPKFSNKRSRFPNAMCTWNRLSTTTYLPTYLPK